MSPLEKSNGYNDRGWEELVHEDCARFFFNESHGITKERFFQVCCRTWMDDWFLNRDDRTNKITYEILWKMLKQIYESGRSTKDCASVIRWILPDIPHVTFTDSHCNDNQNVGSGKKYKALLMNFWSELFKCCENGSSASSKECKDEKKSIRATKRRRLEHGRFASVGFRDLSRGRYKLPAVYLMISLLKETGIAVDWWNLCDLAHQLPSIFKTFAGNDILAGLALVGLANVCTGKPLRELSASALFTTYFSGIDSYGPSILWILNEATGLNLYNIRASICRQVLDHLETCNEDLSEDYKLCIINACAVCIDEEHPERFIDDVERRYQQNIEKKKQGRNKSFTNQSVPDLYASPGFPLFVHIQICLCKNQVERAAEITRKMDSSSFVNDKVRDDAWFNVWQYLLVEGELFLDGNLNTPGYLKKRDFLYNYMACQVSQKAKNAMVDFYQDVANRVCEHEDSSLEEKQYVIFACQQTVLRLLLKRCGLRSNAVLDFIQETKWPIEIPGQKSAKDLNMWCEKFLLQERKVPSTLIDETGLVDLSKRIDSLSQTTYRLNQADSQFTSVKEKPLDPIEPSTAETEYFEERESKSSNFQSRDEPSVPVEVGGPQQQVAMAINDSAETKTLVEADENCEIFEEEDEVVILDDDDSHEDSLPVENQDYEEVFDIDDSSGGEENANGSHGYESADVDDDDDDKLKYSDDEEDEDIIYDVDENAYSDEEEHKGSDVNVGSYEDEEETETLYGDDLEDTSVQERHMESDDAKRSIDEQIEDQTYRNLYNDKDVEDQKCKSDSVDNHSDEEGDDSDALVVNVEDVESNGSDRIDASKNQKSFDGSLRQNESNPSQGMDATLNSQENNRAIDVDIDQNNCNDSAQNNEDHSVVNSEKESYGKKGQVSELSPSLETTHNQHESTKNLADNYDATDPEHIYPQKAHKVRTEVAAVGGEFGDTTEEEDGNDRANKTAQAYRRADALGSAVGYASQVEDGYEPEDTHGYTEEEISEAIHTEDEEDEPILKQKHRLSDNDVSQQQAELVSQTQKKDTTRLFSEQSHDIIGNTHRQNSIEPTSDDMDMADERTEQDEDLGAEFSELEENPECSFGSQLPLSESTQAKTLLEFAQKAQNKDNWVGHLKDKETGSEDVDSRRKHIEEGGQTDADDGLRTRESELNETGTLAFDADDEKYATEGYKSLETEEEEDVGKDSSVDTIPRGVSTTSGNGVNNGDHDDRRNESKIGHHERDIGSAESVQDETLGKTSNLGQGLVNIRKDFCHDNGENIAVFVQDTIATAKGGEDNAGAVSESNALEVSLPENISFGLLTEENIVLHVKKPEVEVLEREIDDNDSKFNALVGEVKGDEEASCNEKSNESIRIEKNYVCDTNEVVPCEESLEIGTKEECNAVDGSYNDKDAFNNKQIESDSFNANVNAEASTISECKRIELRSENDNSFSEEKYVDSHQLEISTDAKKQSENDDGCLNSGDVASGDCGQNPNHKKASVVDDSKGFHISIIGDQLKVSSADIGEGGSRCRDTEGPISIAEDNFGGASSNVDGTQPQLHNENEYDAVTEKISKTDDEVIIDETQPNQNDVARDGADTSLQNESHCNEFSIVSEVKKKGSTAEDTKVDAGDNILGGPVKDANAVDVVESNIEDVHSQANKKGDDKQTKENAIRVEAGAGSEALKFLNAENDGDELEDPSGEMAVEEGAHSEPNQAHLKEEEALDSNLMNNADFSFLPSHNEEALARNYSVEDESSDIPQFIGGNLEQKSSESTRRFGRKKSERHSDDETSVSSSSTTGSRNQVSIKGSQAVADCVERADEDEIPVGDKSLKHDDGGSVISEIFREYGRKKRKRHPDDDKSVSSSTTQRSKKQISIKTARDVQSTDKSQEIANQSMDKVDSRSAKLEISGSKPLEETKEPSTIAVTRSTSSQGGKIMNEEDSGLLDIKKRRGGLPPRPPKDFVTKPIRRNTRSKKNNDDDVSVGTVASTRSTRSAARKLSLSAQAPEQKSKVNAKNHDDVSVETVASTRSARSATRKLASSARAPEQKSKVTAKHDDDASVGTVASTRSTRSATRKLSVGVRAQIGGDNQTSTENDVPLQTITSTRSTRSSSRKLASGGSAQKQKAKKTSNDDDVSLQTITSTRSTRSASRKLSSSGRAPLEKKGKSSNDDVSVETMTSTRSRTRSATRKLSSGGTNTRATEKAAEDNDSYSDWTVKMLQAELKKRKIKFPSKSKKIELKEKLKASDEAKKNKNSI